MMEIDMTHDIGAIIEALEQYTRGGISALPEGTVLIMAHQPITDENGHGEVYASAPPSTASVPESLEAYSRHLDAQATFTDEPAQAVDAVDELREALRGLLASGGVIADASPDELQAALSDPEAEPIVKMQAAAVLRARAALQASRQPRAQQAVAEGAGDGLRQTLIDAGRAIAWQCFGDCRAYDEFGPGSLRGLHEMDAEIRAALATKETK